MNYAINKPLTAEEKEEAKKFAEIARRAEEKALFKLLQANRANNHESVNSVSLSSTNGPTGHANSGILSSSSATVDQTAAPAAAKFLTKQEREILALKRLEVKRKEQEQKERRKK